MTAARVNLTSGLPRDLPPDAPLSHGSFLINLEGEEQRRARPEWSEESFLIAALLLHVILVITHVITRVITYGKHWCNNTCSECPQECPGLKDWTDLEFQVKGRREITFWKGQNNRYAHDNLTQMSE